MDDRKPRERERKPLAPPPPPKDVCGNCGKEFARGSLRNFDVKGQGYLDDWQLLDRDCAMRLGLDS